MLGNGRLWGRSVSIFGCPPPQDHSDLSRDEAYLQSRFTGGLGGVPPKWRSVSFLPQQAGVFARSPHVLATSRPRYADRTMPDDVSGTEVCLCQARSNRLDNKRTTRT